LNYKTFDNKFGMLILCVHKYQFAHHITLHSTHTHALFIKFYIATINPLVYA